jgi:uncharacterized membrane protein YjdF
VALIVHYVAGMAYALIGIIVSAGIVILAIVAKVGTYHAAPVFLLPMLWGVYALRHRFKLSAINFALFGSALLLHMLGALGYYQNSPLPFSFDILVHYYFAMVVTFGLAEAFERNYRLRPWHVLALTFFFMMGFAAVHEIMEYCSYLLLGEEKGMLKPGTSYVFDTARDLSNNLLGTLTGLALRTIYLRLRNTSAKVPAPKTASEIDPGSGTTL